MMLKILLVVAAAQRATAGIKTPIEIAYNSFQKFNGDVDLVSPTKVAELITNFGLPLDKAVRFEAADINGAMLRLMTDEKLAEIGFDKKSERKKLLTWISIVNKIEVGEDATESYFWPLLSVLIFPPLAVWQIKGTGLICCCNLFLTVLYIPGTLHALYLVFNPASSGMMILLVPLLLMAALVPVCMSMGPSIAKWVVASVGKLLADEVAAAETISSVADGEKAE